MAAAAAGDRGGDGQAVVHSSFYGEIDEPPPRRAAGAVGELPGQSDFGENGGEQDERRRGWTNQTPAPPGAGRGRAALSYGLDVEGQEMDEPSPSATAPKIHLDAMYAELNESNVDEELSLEGDWMQEKRPPTVQTLSGDEMYEEADAMTDTGPGVQRTAAVTLASGDDDDEPLPPPPSLLQVPAAAVVLRSGGASARGDSGDTTSAEAEVDLDERFEVGPDSDVRELLDMEKLLEGDEWSSSSATDNHRGPTEVTLRELQSRMRVVERSGEKHAKVVQKAVYGSIHFPTSSVGLTRTATYVRLYAGDIAKEWPSSEKASSKPTNAKDLKEAAETASHFIQYMMKKRFEKSNPELLKPSLVLSVTGGATSFHLSDNLENAIVDGLSSAIRKSKAWVISGGTNVGVMKKIGDVMRSLTEEKQGFVAPVIGVATWGIVKGREGLCEGLDLKVRMLKDYEELTKQQTAKRIEKRKSMRWSTIMANQMEASLVDESSKKSKQGLTEGSETPYDAHKHDTELEPNHNMFFFVDDGTEANFGGELSFRAALEEKIHSTYKATVVSVMIQGGPNTITTSFKALKKGTPLVVIEGSGGAADVIAYAWNFVHSGSLLHTRHTYKGLQKKIKDLTAKIEPTKRDELREKLPDQVLHIVRVRELVVLYSNKTSEYPSLEDAILRAVFNKLRSDIGYYVNEHLRNKEAAWQETASDSEQKRIERYREQLVQTCQFPLQHATNFNRLDLAEEELDLLEDQLFKLGGLDLQQNRQQGSVFASVLNMQLLYALKNNAPDFVELYLSRGAKASELRPSLSFKSVEAKADESRMVYDVGSGDVPHFALAVEELYRGAGLNADSHVGRLAGSCGGQKPRLKLPNNSKPQSLVAIKRQYNVGYMERILSKCADGALILKRAWLAFDDKIEQKDENLANHILFMWALCLNKYRIAEFFWLRTNHNVANALVARCILANLAKHPALQGKRLADEREKFLHNAEKWEDLAWGVLLTCNADDSSKTRAMLESPLPLFGENDAMTVAYNARCLEFLSHTAVQAKVEKDWKRSADAGDDTRTVEDEGWSYLKTSGEAISSDGSRSLGCLKHFSPRTRFRLDLLSYVAMCLLLSYTVLDDFAKTIKPVEWVLLVWFVALATEELREFFVSMALVKFVNKKEYRRALRNHFISWNSIDLVILAIYFSGFAIRISKPSDTDVQVNAKAVFSVLAVVLWTRLLRYYAISKTLGPKVVMIFHMLRDVGAFIALLGAFLLGCGVAAQGILAPTRPIDGASVANVFYQPYFRIYGELFLEENQEQAECRADRLLPFSKCSQSSTIWLAPVFIAVYMLVANVLLLNLLIAQFNETYIRVQEKAKQHWNLLRYELFLEYENKPWLPGPLMLLWNAILFLIWLGRRCRRCCKASDKSPDKSPDGSGIRNHKDQRLDKFESRNARLFIEERRLQRSQTLDFNVHKLLATVDSVTRANAHNREMLNTLLSRQLAGDSHSTKDPEFMRHQSQSRIKGVIEEIELIPEGFYCDEKGHHIQRKDKDGLAHGEALYYTRNIDDPPNFEDPKQTGYPQALPGKRTESHPDPSDDGLDAIDFYGDEEAPDRGRRRSKEWQKMLFEWPGDAGQDVAAVQMEQIKILKGGIPGRGRPINPFGKKTGMRGRGVLWRWGTNWAADILLTRFRLDPVTGAPLMRNGRQVLEFLCMKRPNGDWAIPGCMMRKDARVNDEELKVQLKNTLKDKVLQHSSGLAEDKQDEILSQLFKLDPMSKREAYSADPRNTDNAWIETQCWHIHDSTGTLMEGFELRHFPPQEQEREEERFRQEQKREEKEESQAHAPHVGGGKMRDPRFLAAWMMVHSGLKQFASHNSLLKAAAIDLNAYYEE